VYYKWGFSMALRVLDRRNPEAADVLRDIVRRCSSVVEPAPVPSNTGTGGV
jgi:hypothetical protein